MQIEPRPPTTKGASERVGRVRFAPGTHTAWHRHANGQTLHVIDGQQGPQTEWADQLAGDEYPVEGS